MLKRISCDQFLENGVKRPPFEFKDGLNTILGNGQNSNSVGKSTLLMIIDFCFGGNDYVDKEKDTLENIGDHKINFEFVFNGKSYYFYRNTMRPDLVAQCGPEYRGGQLMKTETFKKWLLEKYQLNDTGLTFRQCISRFFRIYNRNTHNELRPLNATVREDDKTGIISLLRLFNEYSEIDKFERDERYAYENKIAFDAARRLNLGSIASNKTEYNDNKVELESLYKALKELIEDNDLGVTDVDLVRAREKNELDSRRRKLRNQKRLLQKKLNDINFDKDYLDKDTISGIQKLKEFFPNEEFKEIEEINTFYKEVKRIIKAEYSDTNKDVLDMIAIIDKEIDEITTTLSEYKEAPTVAQSVLDRHAELKARIKVLEESISNFDKKEQFTAEYNKHSESLKTVVAKHTNIIQSVINNDMTVYNNSFFDGSRIPPHLEINGLNSYAFYTPGDTGTGTRFKGVVLFDLSILKETKVPAIAHDSIIFGNVSHDTTNVLFKLYNQITNKQVFVAFDAPDDEDEETRNLLYDRKVVQLFPGPRSLFGRQWNK